MRKIVSRIDTAGAEFRRKATRNRTLVAEFRARQERARHQRPECDLQRLASQGKMRPRERIETLLDPGTPFLELSSLAANLACDGDSRSAGSISGLGIVSGREVMIRADDPTVKGGARSPPTVRKMVRALDIAIRNRLTVLPPGDSAGGFLPLRSKLFPDRYMGGRVFRNQSILSKLGVPQLAPGFGHRTAGGPISPPRRTIR